MLLPAFGWWLVFISIRDITIFHLLFEREKSISPFDSSLNFSFTSRENEEALEYYMEVGDEDVEEIDVDGEWELSHGILQYVIFILDFDVRTPLCGVDLILRL